MPKSWYSIKAEANSDVAEVSILDYLGNWGVNAQEFLREFRALKASTVKVFINSPGGSVFEALAIFNGMRATGKTIEVHILGVAASAASYIAMAGDKIVMPSNAMMFVHNPINAVYGNAEELRAAADVLDKIGESLLATYRKRFKGEEEALQQLFADESFLTAQECLEYGFCDEVTAEIEAKASFDIDVLPEAVRKVFVEAQARHEPEPKAEPEPKVEPQAAAALDPQEVERIAAEAGVAEYAGVLALDPKLLTVEAVQAAAKEAAGVLALHRMVGSDKGPEMVRARKTYAEARASLADLQAAADAGTVVNTAQSSAAQNPAPPADLNPLALWAEIKTLQRGSTK